MPAQSLESPFNYAHEVLRTWLETDSGDLSVYRFETFFSGKISKMIEMSGVARPRNLGGGLS
jgi:hypothetical protein